MFKNLIKRIYILLFYLMRIFKINKSKIIVVNFNGKGYGDSPKYIINEIKNNKDYIIIWSVNKKNNDIPSNIKQVKYQSIRWIFHMSTSKIWINNCRFPSYVRKRKGQYYIQTWHGGIACKKIEYDVLEKLPKNYIECMNNDKKMTDLMISNGKQCTNLYRTAFLYTGKIEKLGLPRNDVLICEKDKLYIKARKMMKISLNEKILLYAPTFRAKYDHNPYDVDFSLLRKELEKKYNCKWNIIIRLHPNISKPKEFIKNLEEYIDGSKYTDIQELICASDLLLTDLSSTMFEAMLVDKPAIMYINDYEEYNDDRGTYIDLNTLPFPLTRNNKELIETVKKIDLNKIVNKYKTFEKNIGLFEDGKASKRLAKIIIKIMNDEYKFL